ncbi:hypothetical protein Cantr_04977 [Candida viswanathii]|uniref:Uncharacterized protein n=1 Tax=Candida viswanathii TaxID=5486 RepID=A0A367XST0_9ASCO|nr:hypothetical protein Cantr_04977 [Candida viswanathii]
MTDVASIRTAGDEASERVSKVEVPLSDPHEWETTVIIRVGEAQHGSSLDDTGKNSLLNTQGVVRADAQKEINQISRSQSA